MDAGIRTLDLYRYGTIISAHTAVHIALYMTMVRSREEGRPGHDGRVEPSAARC